MTNSIWLSFSDDTNFPKLTENLKVDVAIIGGGITGITTAQLLSQKGLKVAVLEKGRVGTNSSGFSTGNLYAAVSEILLYVRKKFGDGVMEMVVNSRAEAIDLIEKNIKAYNIDCDFIRTDWNYYTTINSAKQKIEKAYEAASKIKMKVQYSDLKETPFHLLKGLKLEGAAQFNPLRYVQGLAKAIRDENCLIFETSEVSEIHEKNDCVTVTTKDGFTIEADNVVHATHTPKGIMTFHTELGPYREYGIACKIKGDFPHGVYFGYYEPTDITSVRTYERNGEKFIICVGEPHKVGQGNSKEHMKRLEDFARSHFDVIEITHRWGAQNYKAADYLPYIGPKSEGSRIYVATGFSSHGLTYGTVAAQVISDHITDEDNSYYEIYRPYRFTPLKSAPKFIKENIDVLKTFVNDYVFKKYKNTFDDVKPGEGKVIDEEGHKLAVFKDDHNGVQICSAICPHMGCIVRWNNAEHSWDCPCHGSRFDTSGEVLEGPALRALASLSELTGLDQKTYVAKDDLERTDQQHVMSSDELVDEASIESFPASDPPGHISKSIPDRDEHARLREP